MKLKTKLKIKKIFTTIWKRKSIVFTFITVVVGITFIILALLGIILLPIKWK